MLHFNKFPPKNICGLLESVTGRGAEGHRWEHWVLPATEVSVLTRGTGISFPKCSTPGVCGHKIPLHLVMCSSYHIRGQSCASQPECPVISSWTAGQTCFNREISVSHYEQQPLITDLTSGILALHSSLHDFKCFLGAHSVCSSSKFVFGTKMLYSFICLFMQ